VGKITTLKQPGYRRVDDINVELIGCESEGAIATWSTAVDCAMPGRRSEVTSAKITYEGLLARPAV